MNTTVLDDLSAAHETCWINEAQYPFSEEKERLLHDAEKICIEPSSCAAFEGYVSMLCYPQSSAVYRAMTGNAQATHILWATGGRLMPAEVVQKLLK